ncbi:MAG: serine/threonine-protein kinase [Chloroflexota bacterium]|nr:MAG: serine/threonine-protein kinase [Chloroflexota bacterium]
MGGLTTRQLPEKSKGEQDRRQGLLQAGVLLQARYQVLDTLGVGGFSSVYRARDMHFPTVTRLCAVKEMVHMNRDPKVQELATYSFEREASILATLDHPAVPDVYDYFTEEDRGYLILEYIHGQDLEAYLAENADLVPAENALDWMLQLCDVLEYLHSHKPEPVVFRDLKPSNVMLDRHGRVRLIDFNIAKIFRTGLKGTMIGTEGYSPPEQYRGEATPAGDIYALGATFHHILTRQDPRTEPPFSFAERPVSSTNSTVTAQLEAIINRCLAYEASERYQKVSELREALQAAAGATVVQASPDGQVPGAAGQIAQPAIGVSDDKTVSPLWKFRCEDEIRSTPVVSRGVVYVGAYDHNLYALSADKGKFLWKYATRDGIASSPCAYKESIYVGSSDGSLYAVQAGSGRLQWQYESGGPIYSSPRADFDHVFFGSDDGYLYAINASSGRKVWQANAHGTVRSSPRVADDRIFFGTEGGYVFCVDLSGKVKWQFQAKRSITSTPALTEDIVIVGSMDSNVYAVDAGSGWALWRFRTRRPIASSPAVDDNSVYIGSSDGHLYAIDTFSGRQVWSFKTEGQINSSPAIFNDSIYFGATDGFVYCVDTKRGRLRWRFMTGGLVVSSPTVERGVVYVGSGDHHVYALPA